MGYLFQTYLANIHHPKTQILLAFSVKKFFHFFYNCTLTLLAKCMEMIVCNQLVASVANHMDPLQCVYKARRGVDDACLVLMNLIANHLDKSGSYLHVLFMDFSSAFNTIQPPILIKRLDLDTNHTLVLWIRQFLCDRPWTVSLSGTLTDGLIVNAGTPQGCVLLSFLFSVCTNEVVSTGTLLTLVKFADNMALVDASKMKTVLQNTFFKYLLNAWFKENFLVLYVSKQKNLCLTIGKKKNHSNQ